MPLITVMDTLWEIILVVARMCDTQTSSIVEFNGGPWVGPNAGRPDVTGVVGATHEQCLAAQVATEKHTRLQQTAHLAVVKQPTASGAPRAV